MVVSYKDFEGLKSVSRRLVNLKEVAETNYRVKVKLVPEADESVVLSLQITKKGLTKTIEFEDCFPLVALPEAEMDFNSFLRSAEEVSAVRALALALETVLSSRVSLKIEVEDLIENPKIYFELRICMFITYASCPLESVEEFFFRKKPSAEA